MATNRGEIIADFQRVATDSAFLSVGFSVAARGTGS